MPEHSEFEDVDAFIEGVLAAGAVPAVPAFLGEEWEPLADALADLLHRFESTLVFEATISGGTEAYAQFARRGDDIDVELVSNEYLQTPLPPERISLLLELGWSPPTGESPNFSQFFTSPIDVRQLAWLILQVLHEVYGAQPDDQWAVSPASLMGEDGDYPADDDAPIVELDEIEVLEGEPLFGGPVVDLLAQFRMPKAPSIAGRLPAVTNSFANSIIPAVKPTPDEIAEVLAILGMSHGVVCSYCGDTASEWDHFRAVVQDKRPTGYFSEIHNLVPACGKCNQSKGNKPWRTWMFGSAPLSPKSRGIADLEERAERLAAYEAWSRPTQLNLADLVGHEHWETYWQSWVAIRDLMKRATLIAAEVQAKVADAHGTRERPSAQRATAPLVKGAGWTVHTPAGDFESMAKNRAVLVAVQYCVKVGVGIESVIEAVGGSALRGVPGYFENEDELWGALVAVHGRTEKQRRLWFLDAPLYVDDQTWVLANNVWGKSTLETFQVLCRLSRGAVSVTTPEGRRIHGA